MPSSAVIPNATLSICLLFLLAQTTAHCMVKLLMKIRAVLSLKRSGMANSTHLPSPGEGKWVEFAMPDLFKLSTALIFISSFTMQWAVVCAKRNNKQMLNVALGITALLGIGFMISQYYAWSKLVDQGIY